MINDTSESCADCTHDIGEDEEEGDVNDLPSESEYSQCNERNEVREIEKIIQDETKIVRIWRWVVVSAMVMVAGGVTTATFLFLQNEETKDFENSFQQFASSLVDASILSAKTMRDSCSDFSDYMTSSAKREKAEWPFYTIPDWSIHAENVLRKTNSMFVVIVPELSQEHAANWTNYVLKNSGDWTNNTPVAPGIFYIKPDGNVSFDLDRPGPYAPIWQVYPLPQPPITNYDLYTRPDFQGILNKTKILGQGAFDNFLNRAMLGAFLTSVEEDIMGNIDEPYAPYFQPVYDNFNPASKQLVAHMGVYTRWGATFSGLLPDFVRGIHLVLENTCNPWHTWEIVGKEAVFLTDSDVHDQSYDHYKVSSLFTHYKNEQLAHEIGLCSFSISVYPTSTFEDKYRSSSPIIITCIVGGVFIFMIAAFIAYDNFQRKRNTKVVANAALSNRIVKSLFPSNVRDRLFESSKPNKRNAKANSTFFKTNTGQLTKLLDGHHQSDYANKTFESKPIADLFLETTIMFADITGFTAWASSREPTQVFLLLEGVFSALDQIAHKRRIFKVETVGDCYVAVAGLPEPRKDHALAMASFADDTRRTVHEVVKRLELSLGPGTGDLGVRIGLHSGVVTAGVLRGDRARFQLFGDTMNTASRIESTGEKDRIHASKETADLLVAGGKAHWVRPRQDLVTAKGKGSIQTFWVQINKGNSPTALSATTCDDNKKGDELLEEEKTEDASNNIDRLVIWQVDVFSRFLKKIVASRNALQKVKLSRSYPSRPTDNDTRSRRLLTSGSGRTCLDEVKEIISLPEFDDHMVRVEEESEKIELEMELLQQLRLYISDVAQMYRQNDFHNFEHACHVTMSVTKLLSRIIQPSDLTVPTNDHAELKTSGFSSLNRQQGQHEEAKMIAFSLHERTYGITSDPLTQFAMVFSALIHDVDHTGVQNATLITEDELLAQTYDNKSVAEQNSIHLAWDLLQNDRFPDLRAAIYSNEAEYERFRQLVVQTVLATDIVDQELKQLRNARWDNAFEETNRDESPSDTRNRKATIVIEHLIQASDVAHTMQHWHVYRKWNTNFFRECYKAYKDGRTETDPSFNWYKGELGFFDFYIIPLAKKLKKCGVFGVSSDEYLNYALRNRQEWEDRGQEVVEEMVQQALMQQHQSGGESIGHTMPSCSVPQEEYDDKDEKTDSEMFSDDSAHSEKVRLDL